MDKTLRQRVLPQLAAIAIGAGSGSFEPTASLLGIPESELIELVDSAEEPSAKRQYLALLTMDARDPVRERVADATRALAEHSPSDAEPLLRILTADTSPRVRAAASRALMALLEASPPFDRVAVVSRWTLSNHASERVAIARALQSRTPVFVADLALEALAGDPDPRVRAGAARAMARRMHEDPNTYSQRLAALSTDANPRVGRTATRLLRVLSNTPAQA